MGIHFKIKVSDPELGLLLRGNESNRSLRSRWAGICWCRQAKGRYLTQMAKSEHVQAQVHVSGNLLNNVKKYLGYKLFDALQSKALFRFCSEGRINRTVKPCKYPEWRARPWSVAGTFPLNRSRKSDIEKEERTTDSDTERSGQVCDQNARCLSLRHFYSSTGFVKEKNL